MQRTGDQLLAGAAFSSDQHGLGIVFGIFGDAVFHLQDPFAVPQNGVQTAGFLQGEQFFHSLLQGLGLQGQLDDQFDGIRLKGFFDIIVSAQFDRLHRRFHRGEAGNDDHQQLRLQQLQLA